MTKEEINEKLDEASASVLSLQHTIDGLRYGINHGEEPPPPQEDWVLLDHRFQCTVQQPMWRSEPIKVEPGGGLYIQLLEVTTPPIQPRVDSLLVWVDVLEHAKNRDAQWQFHVEHGASERRFYFGSRDIGWPGDEIGTYGGVYTARVLYRVPEGAENIVIQCGEAGPPRVGEKRTVSPPYGWEYRVRVTR